MRWAGQVVRIGEMRIGYRVIARNPERKRPPERHRRRYEFNIKMDLKDMGCEVLDWIHLFQEIRLSVLSPLSVSNCD
jgi:hypothetical protein